MHVDWDTHTHTHRYTTPRVRRTRSTAHSPPPPSQLGFPAPRPAGSGRGSGDHVTAPSGPFALSLPLAKMAASGERRAAAPAPHRPAAAPQPPPSGPSPLRGPTAASRRGRARGWRRCGGGAAALRGLQGRERPSGPSPPPHPTYTQRPLGGGGGDGRARNCAGAEPGGGVHVGRGAGPGAAVRGCVRGTGTPGALPGTAQRGVTCVPCGDSALAVLPARPASVHGCGSCSAASSHLCALLSSVQCVVAALRCWPCAMRSDIWGLLSPCSAAAPPDAVQALCSAWCSDVVLAMCNMQ